MSEENDTSDSEQNGASKVSISFDVFETFYKENSDLDNAEYYDTFPSVNKGTIRSWKARAKNNLSTTSEPSAQTPSNQGQESAPKENKFLKESIEILKKTTRIDPKLLDGLDLNSQYRLLKNAFDNSKPDPNIRLMTPSGSESQKLGIEQFLTIDEKAFREKGFGEVNAAIPASYLFNPKKSKELGEYK